MTTDEMIIELADAGFHFRSGRDNNGVWWISIFSVAVSRHQTTVNVSDSTFASATSRAIACWRRVDHRWTALGRPGRDPKVAVAQDLAATGELVTESRLDVEGVAALYGLTCRVVHDDGQDFHVTSDGDPCRLNLTVVAGVVTQVTVG
jgi:hypothetical protein